MGHMSEAQIRDKYEFLTSRYSESPTHQLLGLTLESIGKGTATVRLDGNEKIRNRMGSVHGAVQTAMIDSAMTQSILTLLADEDLAATIELKVNFLIPAQGSFFRCEGSVIRLGRTIAVAQASVFDADRRQIAVGMGTFHIRGAKAERS